MKSSWKLVFEHFRVKVENQVLRVQGPDLVEKTVKRLTLLMSLLVILDAKEDFKLAYACVRDSELENERGHEGWMLGRIE